MKLSSFARPTATTAIAVGALVVALGGSAAVASGSLQKGDSLIKKHTLSGNRLHNNTITGTQVKESTLGTVPKANTATHLPALVWLPLTLENGWTAYASNYSGAPEYAIDALGFVHLRGALDGSARTAIAFATLPQGFLPLSPHVWLSVASTNGANNPQTVGLDIQANGQLLARPGAGANLAFVSLDGLEFIAR